MQTITLPADAIEKLERELERTLANVRQLKKKQKGVVNKKTIRFWTKEEWEKAEREADEDIKAGRVSGPFKNAEDLIKSLHNGN